MNRLISLVAFALLLVVCLRHTGTSSTQGIPTPEFVAQALRAQESNCGSSLEVTFDMKFGPLDARSVETIRYIRTPHRLVAEKDVGASRHTKIVYDRTIGQSKSLITDNGGQRHYGLIGSNIRKTIFATQSFVETARYFLFEGPLCELVRLGSVSDVQEEVDGSPCWRIEVPSTVDAIAKYIVWVDQNIGFCPRQIHVVWKDRPIQAISFKNYREVSPDIWFPMDLTVDLTTAEQLKVNVECSVTNVAVDKPFSPDDLAVTFPSGTTVSIGNSTVYTVP